MQVHGMKDGGTAEKLGIMSTVGESTLQAAADGRCTVLAYTPATALAHVL